MESMEYLNIRTLLYNVSLPCVIFIRMQFIDGISTIVTDSLLSLGYFSLSLGLSSFFFEIISCIYFNIIKSIQLYAYIQL